MKKILFGLCALSVLYGTSCKKNDDNNGGGSNGNNIVIDGTGYSTTATGSVFLVQGPQIAIGGQNNGAAASLSFTFGTNSSPAAGTYDIVDYSSINSTTEVGIMASLVNSGQTKAYGSTAATGGKVTVSVNNGKYTLKMSSATLGGVLGTSGNVSASCDATQQ